MKAVAKRYGKLIVIIVVVIAFVLGAALLSSRVFDTQQATEYKVTFVDDNGFVEEQKVESETNAIPPANYVPPEGKVFKGWRQSIDDINGDTIIQADLENVTGENVFTIDSAYCPTNGQVSVPLKLQGNVSLCSFELVINYPIDLLEFKNFDAVDPDMLTNYDAEKGEIYIVFASGTNVTGSIDICDLVFAVKDGSNIGELGFSKVEAFLVDGEEILEAHSGTVFALVYPY
jgi:hypothetical protein